MGSMVNRSTLHGTMANFLLLSKSRSWLYIRTQLLRAVKSDNEDNCAKEVTYVELFEVWDIEGRLACSMFIETTHVNCLKVGVMSGIISLYYIAYIEVDSRCQGHFALYCSGPSLPSVHNVCSSKWRRMKQRRGEFVSGWTYFLQYSMQPEFRFTVIMCGNNESLTCYCYGSVSHTRRLMPGDGNQI